MTTAFGILPQGFIRKPLSEILDEVAADYRGEFGQAIKTIPQSFFGRCIRITAKREDALWSLVEALWAQMDPASAEDIYLDILCSYTGTVRKDPTIAQATQLLAGDPATTIPAGSAVRNSAGDITAETATIGSLATAPAWATSHAYVVGDVVRANSNIYVCEVAGTSSSGGSGPAATTPYPGTIADGSVQWVYVSQGTGFDKVTVETTVAGAISASKYALKQIGTPVTGWRGTFNITDLAGGSDAESDDDLRLRRALEIHGAAKSTLESIRAALVASDLVDDATVFENTTDVTDADGLPPHSIEALVVSTDPDVATPGTPESLALAQIIFDTKPAGIATHGGIDNTITDSQGIDHIVSYSVPTPVLIYLRIELYVRADRWPIGDTRAAEAAEAFGDKLANGQDVRPGAIVAAIFDEFGGAAEADATVGLLDVIVRVGTSAPSGSTPVAPITIAIREKADFSQARINQQLFLISTP